MNLEVPPLGQDNPQKYMFKNTLHEKNVWQLFNTDNLSKSANLIRDVEYKLHVEDAKCFNSWIL